MKATESGVLQEIPDCYIEIPIENSSPVKIFMKSLPEVSDSKQAVYSNDPVMGRSVPLYTYSHSADRQIQMQIHFFVTSQKDIVTNIIELNAIRSAVYPRKGKNGIPYMPPPVCKIRCGQLLANDEDLCVVLQSYSVKYPTDVIWDEATMCPYKFDVDTSWLMVCSSENLPYQSDIANGRIISSNR